MSRRIHSSAVKGQPDGFTDRSRRSEVGDTLVEVLLALIVLSLASVALIIAFSTTIASSAEHRRLATGNIVLGSVSQQAIAEIQGQLALFQTCQTVGGIQLSPTANAAYYNSVNPLTVPSGDSQFSAKIVQVQYWSAASASFTSTCSTDVPEEITIVVMDNTGHTYQNSFVVDYPLTSANSSTNTGPATHIVFTTAPSPSDGYLSGIPFGASDQPVIEVENSLNQPVSSDLSPVVLSVQNGANGTLSGCSGDEVSGIITFSGCTINLSGTNTSATFTLSASDGNFTAGPTASFTVTGPTPYLVFVEQPVGGKSGQPLATYADGDQAKIEVYVGGAPVSWSGTLALTTSGSNAHLTQLSGCNASSFTTTNGIFNVTGCSFIGGYSLDQSGQPLPVPYTMTATGTPSGTFPTIIPGTSAAFGVTGPGSATQMAFSTQPVGTDSATVTSPFSTQPVVTLEDAFGNVATGLNTGTVSLTISSGKSASGLVTVPETLTTCPSASITAGVATFANCAASAYAQGVTLTAASTGFSSITSNSFNVTGVASSLVFTQQPIAGLSGTTMTTQPIITIYDSAGFIVTASSTPITFTTSPINLAAPQPQLSLCSELTPINGVVTAATCAFTGIVGTYYTMTAQLGALTVTSNFFTPAGSGSPTQLVFTTQPVAGLAGSLLTTQPVIKIEDSAGNVVTGSADVITLTPYVGATPSGTLSSCTNLSSVTGVVNVANCTFGGLVTNSYTLVAASTNNLSSATSSAFSPTGPGPVSNAASIVSATPASVISNGTSSSTITVTLYDAFGNPIPNKVITLSAGGGHSVITPASGTTNPGGVATFHVTDTTADETVVYSATDTTDAIALTPTATVVFTGPVSAATSTVVAVPTSITADGASISTITVTLEDAGSLPVPGQVVTLTAGSGSSIITTVSGTSNASGVATFTVTDLKSENVVYTAADTTQPITITQTATVSFSPGPVSAATSTVVAIPTSVTADGASTSTITVTLYDTNNNPVAGQTVTLSASGGSSNIVTLSGVTNSSGVATFRVTDLKAETVVYTAVDTTLSLTVAATATVTFTPGPVSAANSVITASPGTLIANGTSTSTVTVQTEDAQGNDLVIASTTPVLHTTSGTLGTVSYVGNGQYAATFTSPTTSGTATLTGTIGGFAIGTPGSVILTAGAETKLVVTTEPNATVSNGSSTGTVVVTVEDVNGNTVSTSSDAISVTSSAGTLGGTKTVAAINGVATFSNLTLTGLTTSNPFQLTFAFGTLTPGVSSNMTLLVSAPTTEIVSTQPAGAVNAVAFTTQPAVTVTDIGGNPVAGSVVTVTKASGTGTLSGTLTATTNSLGVAAFSGLTITGTAGPFTLTFTDGALTVNSASFTLTPGAPTTMTMTTQPAGAVDGVNLTTQPSVTLKDASGNLLAAGSTVTVTIHSGAGTLTGSTTATTNSSGVAIFSGLKITGTIGAYTLTFTDGAATVNSGSFTLTVGAPAAIAVNTQPAGAVDGVAFSTQPIVTVTDVGGNLVNGTTVTATINSGTGTLGGTTAVVANASGVATFTNLKITGTIGAFTLTFTDGAGTANSGSFNVTVGAATTVTVTTPPAGAVNAVAFTTQPAVTVTDIGGNPVAGAVVTATIHTGTGTLSGTTTATTNSSGVATFSGLTITGTAGPFTLTFTDGALTVNSASFTLTPGAPTTMTMTTQPAGAVDGVNLTTQPSVTLKDASGNLLAAGSTVTVSINSGAGTLTGSTTAVTGATGIATFSGLKITGTIGAYTLTFTDGAATVNSASFTLTIGAPTTIVVGTQPAGAVDGVAFSTQPSVTVTDVGGNAITGTTVTATKTSGTGTLSGTTTAVTNGSGVATFASLKITGTIGAFTLTFTDGAGTVTSAPFNLTVGAPSTVTINTQPAGAVNAVALTTQPIVTVTDVGGNVVNGSVVTATLHSGTGTLTNATATTNSSGVATFSGLTITGTVSATFSIAFTDGGTLNSGTFSLVAGAPATITVNTQPNGAVDGVTLTTQPKVTVTDSSGNVVGNSVVTVAITSGAGTLSGTTTATTVAATGIATFAGLKITGTDGAYTLTFTDGAGTANATSFNLTIGAASTLTINTQPGGTVNSSPLSQQPNVTVTDIGGNAISGATVTATIATGSNGTITAGSTAVTNALGVATFAGLTVHDSTTPAKTYTLKFTNGAANATSSSPPGITL